MAEPNQNRTKENLEFLSIPEKQSYDGVLNAEDVENAILQDVMSGDFESARRIVLGQRIMFFESVVTYLDNILYTIELTDEQTKQVSDLWTLSVDRLYDFGDKVTAIAQTNPAFASELYIKQTFVSSTQMDEFLDYTP